MREQLSRSKFPVKAASTLPTLLLCLYAPAATAVPYVVGSGTPLTLNGSAAVLNTIDVTSTAASIGSIGVTGHTADTATLVMAPNGAITEDNAGPARIVHNTGTGTPATVTVTAAFANTDLHSRYSNLVDLTCGACGPAPGLDLVDVRDNLATPGSFSGGTGTGITDGSGNLAWSIGVTIATIPDPDPYTTGNYAGSFDLEIFY